MRTFVFTPRFTLERCQNIVLLHSNGTGEAGGVAEGEGEGVGGGVVEAEGGGGVQTSTCHIKQNFHGEQLDRFI